MVNSFISLEPEIINYFDFYFQTKENPLLRWPERANTFWWKQVNQYNKEIMLHRDVDDYGWAAIYQIKKLSEIALTFNYDIFYHITYDIIISNELTQDILNNKTNTTYHTINPNDPLDQWNVSPLFISFDKENLIKFLSKIDKDLYIQRYGFAEDFIELLLEDIPMIKSEFPVEDSITYINGYTIHTFTSSGTFTPNLWNDVSGNNNNSTLNNGTAFISNISSLSSILLNHNLLFISLSVLFLIIFNILFFSSSQNFSLFL